MTKTHSTARRRRFGSRKPPERNRRTTDQAAMSPVGREFKLLFVGLMLCTILPSLSQTLLTTGMPSMVGDVGGIELLPWTMTAFMIASTVGMPVYGKLGDLLGRKGLLMIAIALFFAGSLYGALAGDMLGIVIGRTIQGLGGGGLLITTQAVVADILPPRQRGRYSGTLSATFAAASVAGPFLGGWLTEDFGWRATFWFNVPLSLVALVFCLTFLPARTAKPAKASIDVAGITLLALATTCVVLISSWAGTIYPWSSPLIWGLIALAVAAAISFALVERKVKEPLMPPSIFANRNFLLATGAGLASGVGLFGVITYMPTYFQMVRGLSAIEAGALTTPLMFGTLVASIGSGVLITNTGRYKAFPIIGFATLAATLALLGMVNSATPVALICLYLGLAGLGMGMSMQALMLAVQNAFSNRIVGTATAGMSYFRQMGATLGAAVVGTLFTSRVTGALGDSIDDPRGGSHEVASLSPGTVHSLPDDVRDAVVTAYSDALLPLFLYLSPVAVVGLILVSFIWEKPLATTNDDVDLTPVAPDGALMSDPKRP